MVSFIIPSYNSSSTLSRSIESILSQTVREFEVIIVDSSDDVQARRQVLGFASDRVKVINLDKKTGPAQGRNIGAREARGELFCFIDSDVVLASDWLEKILAAYKDGILSGGGEIHIPEFQKENRIALAQLYLQFNEYLTGNAREERQFVPSCNMFCDSRVFSESGGFPLVRASEDTLFFLGLKGKARVFFVPEAKCYHIFREAKESFLKNQFLLGQYVSIYRRNYYKSWIYKGVFPLILTPLFLSIKLARIFCRVYSAGPAHFKNLMYSLSSFILGFTWWSMGFIKGFVYDDGHSRD